jgi:NAD(P)-dependent dehydrogenase (short-subunit alcohol dehydrogenase family)
VNALNVLVTAGAAGIGWGIVQEFLRAGHRVALCDVDETALARVRDESPEVVALRADVSDETAVRHFVQAAHEMLGGIDVLVNNAGVAGPAGPIEQTPLTEWEAAFAVNVRGAYLTARSVIPHLKAQRGGSILNISTASTTTGLVQRTAYVSSKWALEGMTINLARELGPFGIRVNALRPGFVESPRMTGLIARRAATDGRPEAEVESEMLRYISLRTKVSPADIGAMAVFLASPAGAKISGQCIGVCGNVEWE